MSCIAFLPNVARIRNKLDQKYIIFKTSQLASSSDCFASYPYSIFVTWEYLPKILGRHCCPNLFGVVCADAKYKYIFGSKPCTGYRWDFFRLPDETLAEAPLIQRLQLLARGDWGWKCTNTVYNLYKYSWKIYTNTFTIWTSIFLRSGQIQLLQLFVERRSAMKMKILPPDKNCVHCLQTSFSFIMCTN